MTAAHLVENVIPLVPIRQWVISFPLRIRHYLLEHDTLQAVLEIVVEEVRKKVIACAPEIPNAQIGAVSFIQNFGSTLNVHPHFHLIVPDGVFCEEGEELEFHESIITQEDIKDVQKQIQARVLRYYKKRGWFSNEAIEKMLSYENTGFSLDASVKIHSWDRDGLERLIRYCARPCFVSENLRWNGPWLVYRFSKPTYKGQRFIQLEPVDFLDKIAAFIPLPHRHRRHYHGVFAPKSPLRKKVVAYAKRRIEQAIPPQMEKVVAKAKRVSFDWAELIARIYEVNPLICSTCGSTVKITSFVTHEAEIRRILRGIGWPIQLHNFDLPYDLPDCDLCQLIQGTEDGFQIIEVQVHCDVGPDPPSQESYSDPPHFFRDINIYPIGRNSSCTREKRARYRLAASSSHPRRRPRCRARS